MRLFVAVEVDEAVRALALRSAAFLRECGVTGRFEPPEKLHVTVAFLGSVEQSRSEAIAQALRSASGMSVPFALVFDTIGGFPNERRPRVLWLGSSAQSAAFGECANGVRAAYEKLGFRFDHDATAHVTICRASPAAMGPLPRFTASATLSVNGLTLFQSLPAGQTTRYEALERTTFPPS
jgi:RNA 2',3'-cyclic 3'-phosphodiesterase